MAAHVTLKFRVPAAGHCVDRAAHRRVLEEALAPLQASGVVKGADIQTVFPDDQDPMLASMFVIKVTGRADAVVAALRGLDQLEYVEVAPEKRLS